MRTHKKPLVLSDKPIAGIGNACIDVMARIDEAFLDDHAIPKGQCIDIDLATKQNFETLLGSNLTYQPGGDVGNTLSCYNILGGESIFIGRCADDGLGVYLMGDWEQRKIGYFNTPVPSRNAETDTTTCVFCLTTADMERSFANYQGVGIDFSKADIATSTLDRTDFLHLSGYMLVAPNTAEAYLYAAEHIHKNGGLVAFSPSDLSIIAGFPDAVERICAVADGIFLNQPDALHLTKTDNLNDAFAALKANFAFGFVTLGKAGVWAFNGDEEIEVGAVTPPAEVIDTNGAGDNFTGGFLYGMRKGWSLHDSCVLGSTCAARIVTMFGARLPADTVFPEMLQKRVS